MAARSPAVCVDHVVAAGDLLRSVAPTAVRPAPATSKEAGVLAAGAAGRLKAWRSRAKPAGTGSSDRLQATALAVGRWYLQLGVRAPGGPAG